MSHSKVSRMHDNVLFHKALHAATDKARAPASLREHRPGHTRTSVPQMLPVPAISVLRTGWWQAPKTWRPTPAECGRGQGTPSTVYHMLPVLGARWSAVAKKQRSAGSPGT